MQTNPTIRRLAKKLRSIYKISYEASHSNLNDMKVIEAWPDKIKLVADGLVELAGILTDHAGEVEVYKDHRKEDLEVMIALTQAMANMSTVLGGEGQNLEVLTHNDPYYIRGILVGSGEEGFCTAITEMTPDQKETFEARLAKAGII